MGAASVVIVSIVIVNAVIISVVIRGMVPGIPVQIVMGETMEGEYKNTMQKKELYLYEEKVSGGAGYYAKMLQYNRIPGVLPFTAEQAEERPGYRYEIGTKCALTECREYSKMNHVQIEKLIRGIVEVIEHGREYLIHESDYVLKPEYIFLASDSEQVYLCCYPSLGAKLREQMAGLFEYLLSHIDYQDFAAVTMAYELYMRSKAAECCFADFLEILAKHGNRAACEEAEQPEIKKAFQETVITEEQRKDPDRRIDYFEEKKSGDGKAEIFEGREEMLESQGETENAAEIVSEMSGYCLRAESLAESLKLVSFPCYISSEGVLSSADKGAPVLGKTQARISLQRDSVYIEDMKSETGTFVNGRRIAGNEIYKLNIGDSVMLADRCYRFVREG